MNPFPVISLCHPDWSRSRIQYTFQCPGCGYMHWINVDPEVLPCWKWNGSVTEPTFSPPLRIEWKEGNVCEFSIENGMISFSENSTHELKGQSVRMKSVL